MKKLFIFFSFSLFFNCGSDTIVNDCFPNVSVNRSVNLNLPEFNALQVPLGFAITSLGSRDILLINGTSSYKAYDLECPERNCATSMDYDGLKLTCSCTGKEYNSLNGSPIDGEGCFALEYTVLETSSTSLQITR